MNSLAGQKLSITSRKPQTTQRRLSAVKTGNNYQVVYVDTPGMQSRYKDAINQFMRREILGALTDIDVLLFVVEALKWTPADEEILSLIEKTSCPVFLLINKIDKVSDRTKLLPFISMLAARRSFAVVMPLSASKKVHISELEKAIVERLPRGAAMFPEDQLTDRSEQFFAAEFIREKLIRKLGEELPYSITVTIEKFSRQPASVQIDAAIWVENSGQKAIVIGKDGSLLKSVGEQARKDIERLLDCHVYLRTWVKVRKNWTDDQVFLKRFGFVS